MNTITEPVDFKGKTVEAIIEYFDFCYTTEYLKYFKQRSEFYCGITNNISSNLSRHGIKGYTACVECSSLEVSSQVEAKLRKLGFDIGDPKNPAGNGGVSDSTIVYMAYKEDGFKP